MFVSIVGLETDDIKSWGRNRALTSALMLIFKHNLRKWELLFSSSDLQQRMVEYPAILNLLSER